MGRKRRAPTYWEEKPRKIVVILFEETKEFFINDTTQKNLWKYYDEHFRGRNRLTRDLFSAYIESEKLPPMFHICTVNGKTTDSFQRRIEVSRYFVEHGYKCLVGGTLAECVEEFEPDKSEYFLSIKDIPLEEMCAPEKNLFPNFKNNKQQRTEKSKLREDQFRISIIVNADEHEKYKKLAEQYGISMSKYLLECARFGGPMVVDTSFMEKHTKAINNCYNLLQGIMVSILLNKRYYPEDIIKMQELTEKIAKSNSDVKNELSNLLRQLRRLKTGKDLTKDQLE